MMLGMLLLATVIPALRAVAATSGVPRPVDGLYFGSWVKPLGGESKQDALVAREQQIGRRYAIDHQYYKWNSSIPTAHETWTASQGRIPFLTWNAQRTDGTVASWSRIASGAEDSWIASRADAFKAFGTPAYLSFHHEPENDVPGVGQPADFAAAFRRIVDVFRSRGVTNVTFVWTMMAWSFERGGRSWQVLSGRCVRRCRRIRRIQLVPGARRSQVAHLRAAHDEYAGVRRRARQAVHGG